MSEKQILYTSDESAKFTENMSGWVDRHGQFWGGDERSARYAGCTHIACPECGKPVIKGNLRCSDCQEKKAIEWYEKREKKEWDGKTMLYSDATGDFFQCLDDAEKYARDNECTLESLRLVLCDPVRLRTIEEDCWYNDLPDVTELPGEVIVALKNLNDVIMNAEIVSWLPGDFAVKLKVK